MQEEERHSPTSLDTYAFSVFIVFSAQCCIFLSPVLLFPHRLNVSFIWAFCLHWTSFLLPLPSFSFPQTFFFLSTFFCNITNSAGSSFSLLLSPKLVQVKAAWIIAASFSPKTNCVESDLDGPCRLFLDASSSSLPYWLLQTNVGGGRVLWKLTRKIICMKIFCSLSSKFSQMCKVYTTFGALLKHLHGALPFAEW